MVIEEDEVEQAPTVTKEEEQPPTEEEEQATSTNRGRGRQRTNMTKEEEDEEATVGGEGIALYRQKTRSFYNIRVKDNFTILSQVLGAPEKMLGAPSNTLPIYNQSTTR